MPANVLLTGATGALGPDVAAELLASGAADRVDVLVRPTATLSARDRFDQWAQQVGAILAAGGGQAAEAARLRLAVGDIAQDGLGLDAACTRALARDTEVIIHAAADTRFLGPADVQRNVNVEGTRRLLEWAATCPRLRRFVLVSTVCVAGTSAGRVGERFVEPGGFVNYYERTKWEAERLALASGLPVSVARVSVVMGSHATGTVYRLGALHHVLRWFGRGLIPLVPGTPRSSVDLIPVEAAARFLARAAAADEVKDGTIWHVAAGDGAAPLPALMDFVWEQFRSFQPARRVNGGQGARVVDAATFAAACRAIDPKRDPILARLSESIDSFLPGLQFPRVFDTAGAQALWGGPLPVPDWRETLGRVIRFLCRHPVRNAVVAGRGDRVGEGVAASAGMVG